MPVTLSADKRETAERPSPDLDLIRELARLLDETGLSEIEIGEGESRIRVARLLAPAHAAPLSAAAVAAAAAPAGLPAPTLDASHPGAVTSPMVGAVYVGPEPGAPPFMRVGDQVSEGQTLLIIEAMKTMNPIRAPRAGRVTRILVENGAPVEYGEVLLIIE
ncbi:MAG: acetyl-CoA carboxylase biotin carboxyl carrier protein [Alphaproteobacteria bacterium]|nr:acetyl-CoA carboxylase biotin carboxyl carrier protein [Alphaproteobacteria bacterium]